MLLALLFRGDGFQRFMKFAQRQSVQKKGCAKYEAFEHVTHHFYRHMAAHVSSDLYMLHLLKLLAPPRAALLVYEYYCISLHYLII